MKRAIVAALILTTMSWWLSSDVWARGGRGGGGGLGGGGRGGGGLGGGSLGAGNRGLSGSGLRDVAGAGARGGYNSGYRGGYGAARTPSMSRPTGLPPSLSRPTGASYASRTPNPRSAYGNLPIPGSRPSAVVASRPSTGAVASRPSVGRSGSTVRPGSITPPIAGTLPAGAGLHPTRDIPKYLDLPTTGSGFANVQLPTTFPVGPSTRIPSGVLPDGAANAFLKEIPNTGAIRITGLPDGKLASTMPARPGAANRPTAGLRPDTGNRPAPGLRPGAVQPGINQPDRPATRPGDIGRPGRPLPGGNDRELANSFPSRIRDVAQTKDWREDHRDLIRAYWRHYAAGDNDDWYDDDWWLYHHVQKMYEPNFDYWKWAEWSALQRWVNSGWSEPVYYNYGSNVYYQDGSVYYGDKPISTEENYAEQAEAIATSAPATKPAAADWMPLGVFAVTTDGQPTGADPTMFLQLAVSKQGIISGTFQNTATDTVQPIAGMIDKQTQRAAWAAAGKLRPLMETGIVNLTQDTTPVLVHFPDDTTQQWLLVRVEKPGVTQPEATQPTAPNR